VYADADDIPGHNALRDNLFQRFVYENGVAGKQWGRRSKYKQPSWCNDGGAEGIIAGIYEMNTHRTKPFIAVGARVHDKSRVCKAALWANRR